MRKPSFDDLSDVYEAMIDWPKRLGHEAPFYRRWFERLDAHSVVDVACGTGRHAAMFHSWGLRVEGSDISPRMIERARGRFGEPAGLRFFVRGFDQPIDPAEPFDVALCVGNSLALAAQMDTARRAVGQMLRAVREGGAIILHVLNLWRLADGPCRWQKCRRAALPQGEAIIVKGVSRCGGQGFVNLVVVGLEGEPALRSESVPFLGLEAEELETMARRAGAGEVQFFGGYHDEPYRRQQSVDLLMVARR